MIKPLTNEDDLDVYYKAELNACALLNSNKVDHPWKRYFKKDEGGHG